MNENKTIKIMLGMLIILAVANFLWLGKVRPQLQEEYISIQTVKLDGEIYVCGTEVNNQDNESLYCRGFTDGHNWAVQQMRIDKELSRSNLNQ